MNKYDTIKGKISEFVAKARDYNHRAIVEPEFSRAYFIDAELCMLTAKSWKSLLGLIGKSDAIIYESSEGVAELKNIQLEMNHPRLEDRLAILSN
jgi:hypothetical protein